ncbi:PAS domain-containing protein [Candidatus Saccharibacteria bacterium]|nr:PAS domain-containing protein [Candidatus Saccharibacteria bacterium]
MSLWNKAKKVETPAPEQSVSASRQNLNELVLQSIHEGVIIVSPNGNIRLANPAFCELAGRKMSELNDVFYDSVINLLDKTGNRISEGSNPINIALKNKEYGEVRDLDIVASDSNKNTPVSIIITPTHEEKPSLVVTFRDIAQELKEERERSEFISTASHEMRTPVASIEGYLGLAMNPSTATVDERGMEYLTKAHEASQHLGRLFQDLLDTTKLDDGQIKARLEPVDIVALVKSIADGQIPNITAKGLGYQFGSGSVDQQLSGGKRIDQLIYASVDADFLREIINNLIENAIKYTPAGWVTVNVRADNYNVQIIVEDTGIGVAREELSHIFQKFYRVDNRDTREIGGTGLGLYLVKQRVEAMNGRIWAESEVGKGTRFIVLIPRISEEVYRQQRFFIDNQQAQGRENIDF